MKSTLQASISLGELCFALAELKNGTSPGPDGIILEFFKEFWTLIGGDYLEMITAAIKNGKLLPLDTKALIALLYKEGERKQMTNWRSIILLNVGYKIYTKALQLRLQPVLMELISHDQSAFLSMRLILDNIVLT